MKVNLRERVRGKLVLLRTRKRQWGWWEGCAATDSLIW